MLFDRFRRVRAWRLNPYDGCVIVTEEDPNAWSEVSHNHLVVRVKDVEEAYRNFVGYYRALFSIPVIAITGTCGKTTAKEIVELVFFCTEVGVRRGLAGKNAIVFNLEYLLGIDDDTNVAVSKQVSQRKVIYWTVACSFGQRLGSSQISALTI